MRRQSSILIVVCWVVALVAACASRRPVSNLPPSYPAGDFQRITNSDKDLPGETALKLPGGPTYAYFRDLMPPLRYVDANFLCYPITLSAPGNTTKARLVSNGSAVNALRDSSIGLPRRGSRLRSLLAMRESISDRSWRNLMGRSMRTAIYRL